MIECLHGVPLDGLSACSVVDCPDFAEPTGAPSGDGATLSPQQIADLQARADWWWDEAAECNAIGAHGLAETCRRAAGRSLDLIGPERSEGPPLARSASRKPAQCVHAGHAPANPAFFTALTPAISASAALTRGAVAGERGR